MRLRCLLGIHDFYANYTPLILAGMDVYKQVGYQYVTERRICKFCKKKEEFIIQTSGKLQDWDVLLSAPNFVSEEWSGEK